MLVKKHIFGKVADPQPATLSRKWTPLQVFFKQFVDILQAPASK